MTRAWLLQANPSVWDVWTWWEESSEELDGWTISKHLNDIGPGDDFALWVSGRTAGVYAIGEVASEPFGPERPGGEYWIKPPTRDAWGVRLRTAKYLFDNPIRKSELLEDPDFRHALIIRMPGTANPVPLSPTEWRAIRSRANRGRQSRRPVDNEPVVTVRPIAAVPEDVTFLSPAEEQFRTYREAKLVKRYERYLNRQLVSLSVLLESGERLICDAYDTEEGLLIEAKASASRKDIRMAIGQLFDYRRHLEKRASLAILVPKIPADDLIALVKSLKIRLLVESRGSFKEV